MNLTKFPQYQLYLLTLKLKVMKTRLLRENCDERCVNATIITRAYYSSYLYCELWLKKMKQFKTKHPWEFKPEERIVGEHKQVRDALLEFGEENMRDELKELASLRRTADYKPYRKITSQDVNESIEHMKTIFNHLKFE